MEQSSILYPLFKRATLVAGSLAVLDEYYGVYVICPDDAQYRLDWIKDIYTSDMNAEYVFPDVFMSQEDSEDLSKYVCGYYEDHQCR